MISRIGGYEDCKLFEDYLMWLKCRKLGLRFLNLPAPLVCMRRASLFERRSGLAYFICEISFVAKAINRNTFPFNWPTISVKSFNASSNAKNIYEAINDASQERLD